MKVPIPSQYYQYKCKAPAFRETSLITVISLSQCHRRRPPGYPICRCYYERAFWPSLFLLPWRGWSQAKLCLHLLLLLNLTFRISHQNRHQYPESGSVNLSVVELSECVCICLRGRMPWRAARMLMTSLCGDGVRRTAWIEVGVRR